MIVYDRLWKTMEKKGISQYSLIHDYNINESQLDRFKKKQRHKNSHDRPFMQNPGL